MERDRACDRGAGGAGEGACASAVRLMAALPDLRTRRAVAGERLTALPPAEAAALLDALLRRAAAGSAGARNALLAWALWRIESPAAPLLVRRLRDAALASGSGLVAALLAESPPRRALACRGRLAEVCIPARRPLDLPPSHRHAKWGWHYYLVERLRRHHDPILIDRLLAKRWLDLRDVLLIAARRPTTPAIARAIVAHDRWMVHAEVREALASNPFTPVEIALSLLPTVRRHVLDDIVATASPPLRDAAGGLLALRTEGAPRESRRVPGG
ncbi:MAG: hypothetical protein IT372_07795 [Polyangiaceae bacterium]|nr:hypothetical protein [Polyangiaceae bacterium]